MRREAWLPLLLIAIACNGPEKDHDHDTDHDTEDVTDDGDESVLCSTAPQLAADGAVTSFDVTWSYDEAGISFGEPILVDVGEDIVGLTMTVDAGSVKSGVATLIMNDVYILDWTGQSAPGSPASRGADTAFDSADTAWETGELMDTGEPGHGWGLDPFYHYLEVAGTVTMPMNETSMPIAGCMMVVPAALGDMRGESGRVLIAGKRGPDTRNEMDFNVWIAEDADLSETEVMTALEQVQHIYDGAAGPKIGEVRTFSFAIEGGSYVSDAGADIDAMRSITPDVEMDHEAMNLFFIADFLGGGTYGIAAGIPGPFIQGTAGSGVTMAVDPHRDSSSALDTRVLGETIAHEVGHQLGLFHTSESEGDSHDVIADTPECTKKDHDMNSDESLTPDECEEFGGRNFMFWKTADYPQDEMTPGQALVLNRSPLAH